MMLVKDILKIKGGQLFSIGPDALLPQAVGLMVEDDIGSLLRAVNFENKLLKQYIKDWPEQGRT